ncbi:beta-ketoacyl synthase [Oceanobacter sp. 3_MG-2023]|uniref:beta-ketoacyl synthase n=1 Tax=Oceanobacter sp. 3_MG-2023 TaxID=3062622 RepID=UPI0027374EBB|nr:beta-ketoacyl synthase [Oceanobacter sp. 3_MG-2023]MDP2506184.1 beta-ketoacyl synthase [Oceanobacter sp. 3_MG-2023]
MKNLAVITGFGGINAAGRSSGHHAFRRMIFESLTGAKREQTLTSLASLMATSDEHTILNGTLVREWDNVSWDAKAVPFHKPFKDEEGNPCWRLTHKRLPVQSAGQLPLGFDPATLYRSLHHPRGLQMAVYGASDALGSLGIEWETLCQQVGPDEIAVYAGSSMGQPDATGNGGMMQAALLGKRTSSKQCAMSMSQMPADFINAYVLGNVGTTGCMTAACATFLYNLRLAKDEIESGKRRIVIVGNSEAPLMPEIVEGYNAMTALASEHKLRDLDKVADTEDADFRRASRPFGENCGFTLAESAQFFILTDDKLALELGLNIHGSIGDVQINADGYKKSISNPGIGNYLTMGKVVANARRLLGDDILRNGSFVHAHGSSTPQNRVTESHIYQQLAGAFKLENWPITAVKAYVGHSLAAASADQLTATLGTWSEGVIPGIKTVHTIADDVHQQQLEFVLQDKPVDPAELPVAFINAKGFGGNNASAMIISPAHTRQLIEQRYSTNEINRYWHRNELVVETAYQYDKDAIAGKTRPRYHFGEQVLGPDDLTISDEEIYISGWDKPVSL